MKELKIEVPQGYEIDKEKSTFEKIIFKKIKVELPKTWDEFCEQNPIEKSEFFINTLSCIESINKPSYRFRQKISDKILLSTKEDAKAHLALIQLHRLRDVYRQGWVPDWNDGTVKYIIEYKLNKICINTWYGYQRFLTFQSKEIAEQFVENFKDLIEKAKELI
jgi:hypothetical protein